MPNKTLIFGLLVCLFGYAANAQTPAEKDPRSGYEAPESEAEKPEHSVRPLSTDTFKPSEEISEDFPVPFPVDI